MTRSTRAYVVDRADFAHLQSTESYTRKADLWQIGQLVLTHTITSAGSAACACQVMSWAGYSAAMAALCSQYTCNCLLI